MFNLPIYCENNTTFFFNEPFNIVTNLTFFISAFFLFRRKTFFKELKDPFLAIFFSMLVLTGIGSTLFHSYRSTFTHKLDAIPIYILFISLFYCTLRSISSKNISFLSTVGFIFSQVALANAVSRETLNLNGSINHLFTLLLFVVILSLLRNKVNIKEGKISLYLFFSAVIFRIIDIRVCESFLIGTHFLWHLFCGAAVYFSYLFLLECREQVK